MNCPAMDHLIDFGLGEKEDPELEAHLNFCPTCRADLGTIRALAGAGEARREVSEEMISRIIAGLPEVPTPQESSWSTRFQPAVTFGLGFLTAFMSFLATGSIGSLGPLSVLLLPTMFGVICVLATRLGRTDSGSPYRSRAGGSSV